MKQLLIVLFFLIVSCAEDSKNKSSNINSVVNSTDTKIKNKVVTNDEKGKEPTYQETADWIIDKLKLYAKGFEREDYFKNPDFEEFYPNVRMTYDSFKIQYGKLFIVEEYRYYGGNVSKENKYNGFILRQNIIEIPINDIIDFELNLEEFKLNKSNAKFCNVSFRAKDETVKHTRNLQISYTASDFDLDAPKPIKEYTNKGGLFIRCNIENDLKNRMNKAIKRLKKLNLERYPVKKEAF